MMSFSTGSSSKCVLQGVRRASHYRGRRYINTRAAVSLVTCLARWREQSWLKTMLAHGDWQTGRRAAMCPVVSLLMSVIAVAVLRSLISSTASHLNQYQCTTLTGGSSSLLAEAALCCRGFKYKFGTVRVWVVWLIETVTMWPRVLRRLTITPSNINKMIPLSIASL